MLGGVEITPARTRPCARDAGRSGDRSRDRSGGRRQRNEAAPQRHSGQRWPASRTRAPSAAGQMTRFARPSLRAGQSGRWQRPYSTSECSSIR